MKFIITILLFTLSSLSSLYAQENKSLTVISSTVDHSGQSCSSPNFFYVYENSGTQTIQTCQSGIWANGEVVSGNTILNGSGVPSSGLGSNGDFYLRTSNSCLYGPKASGAWGSCISLIGSNGTNGNTILSGTSIPSGGTGSNGDFYIINPTTSPCLYGPKTSGAWGSCIALSGGGGGSYLADGTTLSLSGSTFSVNTVNIGTRVTDAQGIDHTCILSADTSNAYVGAMLGNAYTSGYAEGMTVTVNVNNLATGTISMDCGAGAKPVYQNDGVTTPLPSQWSAGSQVLVSYAGALNSGGGGWRIQNAQPYCTASLSTNCGINADGSGNVTVGSTALNLSAVSNGCALINLNGMTTCYPTYPSQIVFDNASNSTGHQSGTTFSYSWTHSVGTGASSALVVFVGYYNADSVIGVTDDTGTAATQACVSNLGIFPGTCSTYYAGTGGSFMRLYYIQSPKPGTRTITVTITDASGDYSWSGAMSFFGVDQGRPIEPSTLTRLSGSSSAPTGTITPAYSGSWVMDAYTTQYALTFSGPSLFTQKMAPAGDGNGSIAASAYGPYVGALTDTWTGSPISWGGFLAEILAATPAGRLTPIKTYANTGAAYVDVKDGYIYATYNTGLHVVNMATGTFSAYTNGSCDMEGVLALTGYALVACKTQGTVISVNTTNKASLTLNATLTGAGFASVSSLSKNAAGTVAYASGNGNLVTIDVSVPSTPTVLGTATSGAGYGEYVNGNVFYTGRGGLSAFDVSAPASPNLLGTANLTGCTTNAQMAFGNSGAWVYVICSSPAEIIPVNVSNPSAMVVGTPVSLPVTPWWCQGTHAYLYVSTGSSGEILAYDVRANPAVPVLVDRYAIGTSMDDVHYDAATGTLFTGANPTWAILGLR